MSLEDRQRSVKSGGDDLGIELDLPMDNLRRSLLEGSNRGDLQLVSSILTRMRQHQHQHQQREYLIGGASGLERYSIDPLLLDLELSDNLGRTALINAARNGYSDIVKLLIASGAKVNAKSKYGSTSLICASLRGFTDCVIAITSAASSGFCVESLDLNMKEYEHGFSAITWSIVNRTPDITQHLIEAGCDLNVKCNSGRSPLNYALSFSKDSTICQDCAKYLIEAGASISASAVDGSNCYTALILAAFSDIPILVELVLNSYRSDYSKTDRRSDEEGLEFYVNEISSNGFSAMSIAFHNENPVIFKQLLFRGANIEFVCNYRRDLLVEVIQGQNGQNGPNNSLTQVLRETQLTAVLYILGTCYHIFFDSHCLESIFDFL